MARVPVEEVVVHVGVEAVGVSLGEVDLANLHVDTSNIHIGSVKVENSTPSRNATALGVNARVLGEEAVAEEVVLQGLEVRGNVSTGGVGDLIEREILCETKSEFIGESSWGTCMRRREGSIGTNLTSKALVPGNALEVNVGVDRSNVGVEGVNAGQSGEPSAMALLAGYDKGEVRKEEEGRGWDSGKSNGKVDEVRVREWVVREGLKREKLALKSRCW